ncbi:MAG: peptidase S9, partial [Bacteroidales bacterium]|nr:peptidase S9 [Bacteroidales bacterium]
MVSLRHFLFLAAIVTASLTACNNSKESVTKGSSPLIGKHDLTLESPIMTPEVLWSFGRISEISVSPDNKKVLYGVTYYSVAEDKGNRELFVMDVDGSNKQQLTHTPFSEYNAVWNPNGSKIGFLSAENGTMQLWEMNADGTGKQQISSVESGINAFKYAPDGKKIVFSADVPKEKPAEKLFEGLDKTTGRLMNDLMYRHWDHWVDTYSHLFIADLDGK